jgi:hypothetical protein
MRTWCLSPPCPGWLSYSQSSPSPSLQITAELGWPHFSADFLGVDLTLPLVLWLMYAFLVPWDRV